ncbi:MAG: exosome complex protein Rrp42 [archaeon]
MAGQLSVINKKTIIELAESGNRLDGRKHNEFRSIRIETGLIPNAQGSALVELGKTKVLAGIKLSVGVPYPDKLDEGVLATGAEMAPIASPDFERGPPSPTSIELARVVDRVIRESETIDTKKLCIKAGEKVWMLNLDFYILDMDGNLIDAGVLAGMAALLTARMPKYDIEKEKIDFDTLEGPVPVSGRPIGITHAKVGSKLLVDPTENEEDVMAGRVTIGINDEGDVCAIQKGGVAGFSSEEIVKIIEESKRLSEELRKKLPAPAN